jgi:hypothetical protein
MARSAAVGKRKSMRSSKPPALAAWLLMHLTPGDNHDALVGDLLEEFQQGRSAGWFWRQVLRAIPASLVHELRVHWVARSLEFGLTWIWVDFSIFHLLPFLRAKLWVMAFEPHARILWRFVLNPGFSDPWIFILLPVLFAAYLSSRRFNFLAFVCGSIVGVLAIAPVTFTVGIALVVILGGQGLLTRGMAPGLMDVLHGYLALIRTIPVVAGIWAAQLIRRRPRAARISN